MNEILFKILTVLLFAVISISSSFLCKYLRKKSAESESAVVSSILDEIARAVTIAVRYVNQTYVDDAKKAGTFDIICAQEAYARAKDKLLEILSDSAQEYLTGLCGIDTYLYPLIEAEVKAQKTN